MSQVDIPRSVSNRDEVLAQLFRHCSSLLRYHGVLVHTDDKGLYSFDAVDTRGPFLASHHPVTPFMASSSVLAYRVRKVFSSSTETGNPALWAQIFPSWPAITAFLIILVLISWSST